MFDKKITEVMTSPVTCLSSSASVRECAQRMRERDIGVVVVCEGDKPVGVITDRDITTRCTALGLDSSTCKCSRVMSRDLYTVKDTDTTKEAESLMEEHQVRRVIVVDDSGKLTGIVALSDIAGADRSMSGRIVEKVTQPASGYAAS